MKQVTHAQEYLYQKYAPRFLSLILRYVPQRADAEDVLVESFFKIFQKVHTYKNEGSFEGWMKKLVINNCLMHIRKNKIVPLDIHSIDPLTFISQPPEISDIDGLKRIIDALPLGYKLIFNLYVVEGFKHKEIARLLGISEHTSKSQLIHAKKSIRKSLGLPVHDAALPEDSNEE